MVVRGDLYNSVVNGVKSLVTDLEILILDRNHAQSLVRLGHDFSGGMIASQTGNECTAVVCQDKVIVSHSRLIGHVFVRFFSMRRNGFLSFGFLPEGSLENRNQTTGISAGRFAPKIINSAS